MQHYEYKVVPAPTKGVKAKGVKSPEARFAFAVQGLMNDLSTEGWDYLRADTLPSVERSGLTGSTTEWRTVLVFRRAIDNESEINYLGEKSVSDEPVIPSAAAAAATLVAVRNPEADKAPEPEEEVAEEAAESEEEDDTLERLANRKSEASTDA